MARTYTLVASSVLGKARTMLNDTTTDYRASDVS